MIVRPTDRVICIVASSWLKIVICSVTSDIDKAFCFVNRLVEVFPAIGRFILAVVGICHTLKTRQHWRFRILWEAKSKIQSWSKIAKDGKLDEIQWLWSILSRPMVNVLQKPNQANDASLGILNTFNTLRTYGYVKFKPPWMIFIKKIFHFWHLKKQQTKNCIYCWIVHQG